MLSILMSLLIGCQTDATPIPAVVPPTPTLTPVPTEPAPVRYALLKNAAGFVPDIGQLQVSAQVEQLTQSVFNPELYDLIAGYGLIPNWQPSPITLHVVLVINPDLAPMTGETGDAASIVRHSIDPVAVVDGLNLPGVIPQTLDTIAVRTLRIQLASTGYPDGFELALAQVPLPGTEQIITQLKQNNLFIQETVIQREQVSDILEKDRAHLLLTFWTTDADRAALIQQVGADNIMELYSLPISYQANPDMTITFTPGGFPIGMRSAE